MIKMSRLSIHKWHLPHYALNSAFHDIENVIFWKMFSVTIKPLQKKEKNMKWVMLWRGPIHHNITYNIAMTAAKHKSILNSQQTPHTSLSQASVEVSVIINILFFMQIDLIIMTARSAAWDVLHVQNYDLSYIILLFFLSKCDWCTAIYQSYVAYRQNKQANKQTYRDDNITLSVRWRYM